MKCPDPGIYENVPAEVYHSWEALSNSGAGNILRSPGHYIADKDNTEETKEMIRGTGGHAAIQEPERFADEYREGPDVKLNTKAGKEQWEAFVAANPGKIHIRGAMWPEIIGIRDAVWNHPEAKAILSLKGRHEVSVVWIHAATGVLCKSRIDWAAITHGIIADLKTCKDCRAEVFSRTIDDRGYHRQGAMYLHAMAYHGIAIEDFTIIAVESEPYHGCEVYRIEDEDLEAGEIEIHEACEIYKQCAGTGIWPGYSTGIKSIGRPKYRRKAAALAY